MKNRPVVSFLLFILTSVVVSTVGAQTRPGANSLPGARHPLSESQLRAIKSIRSESEKKAAPLAMRLGATAMQIYENLLADEEDEQLRGRLTKEMDEVVVGLLSIKGQSIRDMVKVLTAEQKQLIRGEMTKPGAPGDLSELIVKVFGVPEK